MSFARSCRPENLHLYTICCKITSSRYNIFQVPFNRKMTTKEEEDVEEEMLKSVNDRCLSNAENSNYDKKGLGYHTTDKNR